MNLHILMFRPIVVFDDLCKVEKPDLQTGSTMGMAAWKGIVFNWCCPEEGIRACDVIEHSGCMLLICI